MRLPSKGATKLVDVGIAKNTPQAVARGEVETEKGRVLEEEANVGELGLKPGKEGREGTFVAWEVLVALALVVVQVAHLTELVLALRVLLLLLIAVITVIVVDFRVTVLLLSL